MPLMELFATSAAEVAFGQYQAQGRGIILGLQTPQAKKFLYVTLANSSTALWMADSQMKEEVAGVQKKYDPATVAVVVMVVPPTVQLFLAKPDGAMQMLSIGTVELTPITLPPEVTFRTEQEGDTFYYIFTHSELGKMGRIVLKSSGAQQTEIKYEIVGPADSPRTKKRVEFFIHWRLN